jgi:two-component system, NtrC family, sensor kinase
MNTTIKAATINATTIKATRVKATTAEPTTPVRLPHITQATVPTILIIDDTPTNLEVLYASLGQAGYEILVEMDGQSGIIQAQNSRPDVILLDAMMPGIDGFETCRRLKANAATCDIPIIFITALTDSEHKVAAFSVGAVDYVTKPFQQEEVLARVKTHLQLSQMTKTLEEQNTQLRDFNISLEYTASQRAIALHKANMQLIQQEKLSSLGQMVAGIAHEINNPVGFIYSNCSPARKYFDQLLELIQLYQTEHPEPTPRLQQQIAAMDLDFVTQDLSKVINSMQMGADRIRQIVLSLRNFSRLDEAELKPVDLYEGIENTLLILQHRLQEYPRVEVVWEREPLPLINCMAGQMNQVFMNILSNAIDSTRERQEQNEQAGQTKIPACIWIRSHVINDEHIAIQIKDNGTGIPADVLGKLFEPFFTTKPIGKGTGLGLSISYQIVVENHRGNLTCQSIVGQGSEFTITIPIDVKKATGNEL